MSRLYDTEQYPLPTPSAGPSQNLRERAEHGLGIFLAGWQPDEQDDDPRGEEV